MRAYVFKCFHTGQNHHYTNEQSPQTDTAADTSESLAALAQGVLSFLQGIGIVDFNGLLRVQNGVA